MVLANVVRACGVTVGVFGAVIAAWSALPVWLTHEIRPAWQATLARLSRRGQDATVSAKAIAAHASIYAPVVAAGRVEDPNASIDEKVVALRAYVADLEKSVQTLSRDNEQAHREMAATIDQVKIAAEDALAVLRNDMRLRDRSASLTDAHGFLVIVPAFPMTGLPDAWVNNPFVGIPLISLAVVATGYGVGRLIHRAKLRLRQPR